MRDTSLDEFITDNGEVDQSRQEMEETDAGSAEGSVESEARTNPDDSQHGDAQSDTDWSPAISTYEWHAGGVVCEACGSTVKRRWRDQGHLVCESCKDW